MDVVAIRNATEIARLHQTAAQLAGFFRELDAPTLLGRPAVGIDRAVRRYLLRHGLQSALLGYRGYPGYASISPNAVAVHGVPSAREIARGDVVTIDIAAVGGGWCADVAWTFVMPGASRRITTEYHAAFSAFTALLERLEPGLTIEDVATIAEDEAATRNLAVLPSFTGHGIGRQLHEAPVIPFCRAAIAAGDAAQQVRLLPGMVFNIEPVYRRAGGETSVIEMEDGWGFRTVDGAPTYHFELTVAMLADGAMVLQRGSDRRHPAPTGGRLAGVGRDRPETFWRN